MADAPAKPVRPMKFPYTFSAKIAQFPFKHYLTHNFVAKWWILGIIVSVPVFRSFSKLSNSPENVAKWAEIRRKEAAGHH